VKLLLHQNLSPRLASDLAGLFPGSVHVRELGLREAPYDDIWRYAAEHGYVIASKDSDFRQRSFLEGHPPKVVWIALGNCSTTAVRELLRSNAVTLAAFEQNPEDSFLILR